MSTPPPLVTLPTLAAGAVVEAYDAEFDRVLRNIADPNTDPKATRKIVLEIVVKPNEDRDAADVFVKTKTVLASTRPTATRIFIGPRDGKLAAIEADPRQPGLFDSAQTSKLRPINGGAPRENQS